MTDDLSEADEDADEKQQHEEDKGEEEDEEEEAFVTPGKETSMYHSAMSLPSKAESEQTWVVLV